MQASYTALACLTKIINCSFVMSTALMHANNIIVNVDFTI